MEEIQQTENQGPGVVSSVIRVEAATGDLRLHEFRSRIFRNTRFLRVWLPPGYDDPANAGRHYPVLYLNDGQNLFEASTSFTGVEWQVDETGDRLIREGVIPPMILVGMDNAGKGRIREYMPHRSLHPMMLRVQGSRYPSFLIKEVMPFLARNYRVASGPENTGLGRIIPRGADRALHGVGVPGGDWTVAAGESFAVGVEPADHPAEPRREALAAADFPGDRHIRSGSQRARSERG